LKKTKQERDELEKRLNEFLEKARELREQKYNI
jgi:uncharacterized coiled-coil DUF342 family protein